MILLLLATTSRFYMFFKQNSISLAYFVISTFLYALVLYMVASAYSILDFNEERKNLFFTETVRDLNVRNII